MEEKHTNQDSFKSRQQRILANIKSAKKNQRLIPFLIEKSKDCPPFPSRLKKDDFIIPGCLNNLWLATETTEEKMLIWVDSDSKIMKGILTILSELLSGLEPNEIANADLNFFYLDVVDGLLTSSRFNNIRFIGEKIKQEALSLIK